MNLSPVLLLVTTTLLLAGCTAQAQTYILPVARDPAASFNLSGTINSSAGVPLYLNGSATVFDDVVATFQIAASATRAPSFDETRMAWGFHDETNAALEDYAFVGLQMPHSYKEGSNIGCHLHVMPDGTSTNNATWELVYTWTNIGDEQAASTTLRATGAFAGTAWRQSLVSFPEIDGTGKRLSSILLGRVRRISSNATDTYPGVVYTTNGGIDCHVERDSLGSASEVGKWN